MDLITLLIFLIISLFFIRARGMSQKRKPRIINAIKVEDFEVIFNLLVDEMNDQSVLVYDQFQNKIMVLEKYQDAQNWGIKISLNKSLLNSSEEILSLSDDYIIKQDDKLIFNFKGNLDIDNRLLKHINNILIISNVSKINCCFEKKSLWYIKNV